MTAKNPKTADFGLAQLAVEQHWDKMSKHKIFRSDVSGEELWALYLASFPPGSNPMFRKRTEHDCSCCRHFIRDVGNAVAIADDQIVSIWDAKCEDPAFAAVFEQLSKLVKSRAISGPFLFGDHKAGVAKTLEQRDKIVAEWRHFCVKISDELYMARPEIPTAIGNSVTTKDVLERGLSELTLDSVDTVLEMIGQNSLYRGEEHKATLQKFRKLKAEFFGLPAQLRESYVWLHSVKESPAVSRIRNSAIGTLLIDLSGNVDLEDAVRKFEAVVAPANYKRPKSIVTKAMVEKAKEAIASLGLLDSLERRHAVVEDLNIEDVLFVDRDTRAKINGDVFDLIPTAAVKNLAKLEEIPIERFLAEVLPKAQSVEVLFENRHQSNLVSLIAPSHRDSKGLFKWPNPFSWSYAGELADSEMRKAVQARGGSVSGVFRFSHQWNYDKRNASLMDLHVFMPSSSIRAGDCTNDAYGDGRRVGWNRRNDTLSGGTQDVDYTQPAPPGYVPVENITFPELKRMPEGTYVCKIHNWQLRAPTNGGFKAEIEFGGNIYEYEVDRPLANKEWITVAEVTLKDGAFSIKHHLKTGNAVRRVWGIDTGQFHRVKAAMLSPNYWGESKVGNRHLFMMLEACASDVPSRGFYNEFLTQDLDQHRKVLEIVGSKAAITPADGQLSGLGFSTTQRSSFTCKIKGSFNRTITVTI